MSTLEAKPTFSAPIEHFRFWVTRRTRRSDLAQHANGARSGFDPARTQFFGDLADGDFERLQSVFRLAIDYKSQTAIQFLGESLRGPCHLLEDMGAMRRSRSVEGKAQAVEMLASRCDLLGQRIGEPSLFSIG